MENNNIEYNLFASFVNSIQPNQIKYDDFEMLDELTKMKIDVDEIKSFFSDSNFF